MLMLDVAIAGIGISRFHAQGNKSVDVIHKSERLVAYFMELTNVHDQVIRRGHDQ